MGNECFGDELYDEEYSQYLADLGEIDLSDSEQEIYEEYQVDEYNEMVDDDMKNALSRRKSYRV